MSRAAAFSDKALRASQLSDLFATLQIGIINGPIDLVVCQTLFSTGVIISQKRLSTISSTPGVFEISQYKRIR